MKKKPKSISRGKTPKRSPAPFKRLWGIWIPDGGEGNRGGCTQHGSGDGPEAYENDKDAKEAAKYYQNDFPGCFSSPLTEG